jgi:hypothetical protein
MSDAYFLDLELLPPAEPGPAGGGGGCAPPRVRVLWTPLPARGGEGSALRPWPRCREMHSAALLRLPSPPLRTLADGNEGGGGGSGTGASSGAGAGAASPSAPTASAPFAVAVYGGRCADGSVLSDLWLLNLGGLV